MAMSEKIIESTTSIEKKEKVLIPIEDFQSELKTQVFDLLSDQEMIDFNNEEKIKEFLRRFADFLQNQENKDFVLLHKSLGSGEAGVDSLSADEQSRLLNLFNKALLQNGENSLYQFLKKYVDNYPASEAAAETENYSLMKTVTWKEAEALGLNKKNLKRSEAESVVLSLNLYLDYLSALRQNLKEDLFAEFQAGGESKNRQQVQAEDQASDKMNPEFMEWYETKKTGKIKEPTSSFHLSLEEIEAFELARKERKSKEKTNNKKSQKIFKAQSNPSLEMADLSQEDLAKFGFSKEDKQMLIDYLNDWFDYLQENPDWQKVRIQFARINDLKRDLERKDREISQKRLDFMQNPEKYRAMIKNADLAEYWFGAENKGKSKWKNLAQDRLSDQERSQFLQALEQGNLLDFTVTWTNDLLKDRLATLENKEGYLQVKSEAMNRLRNTLAALLRYWPDAMNLYNEAEQGEIIHEWFAPYRAKSKDESVSGKFVRLDYLLRNADNPQNEYFVKDDDSFNRLLGEIKELMVKEIELNPVDFKVIRDLLNDSFFAPVLLDENLESLLEDIYNHENLSFVQEDLWNSLLNHLGGHLQEQIKIFVEYEDEVKADWELLAEFEQELGIKTKAKSIAGAVFSVEEIKAMYDYYKILEKTDNDKGASNIKVAFDDSLSGTDFEGFKD